MFDFIYTFDNWLTFVLNPLMTWVYDSSNGSYYEFLTASVIYYVAYLLFIIAFLFTVTFVFGFVKSAYYFVKEIF